MRLQESHSGQATTALVQMARPSKTKHFAIYEDSGIPTPDSDSSYQPSFDDTLKEQSLIHDDDVFEDKTEDHDNEESTLEDIEEGLEPGNVEPTDTEHEDEGRESAITSTSISSLPESSSETDHEPSLPMHKPYTPPMIRPSFRRPESVRRMQMSSPTPFERSPRRPTLQSHSRYGTPRSVRSSVKGSPRMKRQEEEDVQEEKKEYPLVLLHVTLLPVELRWSMEVMQEVLPASTLDNLQLLRSKVTETILQRGILIPHPREEYELLEERLLEALELRKERVTKCGHFRSRDSVSSNSSTEDSATGSDSGMGSSIDTDDDLCAICQHHVRTARSVHGSGGSKWNIKVFAANGLMRASAWVAAWSEMERVDVEILPWIGEDLRRRLDAGMKQATATAPLQIEFPENGPDAEAFVMPEEHSIPLIEEPEIETRPAPETHQDELPQIYRAQDVPLSLLLKNYIYLLAKDKRNVAIFGLALLALWLSLRAALAAPSVEITPLPSTHSNAGPETVPLESTRVLEDIIQMAIEAEEVAPAQDSNDFEQVLPPAMLHESVEAFEDDIPAVMNEESSSKVGGSEVASNEAKRGTKEDSYHSEIDQSVLPTGEIVSCDNPASTALLFGRA